MAFVSFQISSSVVHVVVVGVMTMVVAEKKQ
jgi:hypothetical protein